MRDKDFYKGYSKDADDEKYFRDLAKLKRIREEEKLKEENEKLYKAIDENNKKLGQINIDNVKKTEKKSEKIEIIGGNKNPGRNERNIKSNINEDLDTDNIKIPLPPSRRRQTTIQNEAIYEEKFEPPKSKKNVTKKIKKTPAKKTVKKIQNVKTVKKQDVKPNNKANNKSETKTIKPKKKRSFLKRLIALVLLFSLISGGSYFAFHYVNNQTGYYTVAVFGVDSRDGNVDVGALADVNMIVNIDRGGGEIQLVSVYRDMYSMIDEEGNFHKFNQAYVKGGPSGALKALNRNLDLNITDYITVNWKAVIDAINILGGVDLEVTEDEFKYINSFITETVEETGIGSFQLEHAGMNHLDGVQAVAYARLRLMDTDFNRTERQRKVVSLAFEKAKHANFATLYSILTAVLPQTSTNVGIDDLIPFAKDISKYHLSQTAGFPFEKDTKKIHKRDYVIPLTLRTNVIALHEMLYGKTEGYTYTPSELLNTISNTIVEDSGMGGEKEITEISVDENLNEAIGVRSEGDKTEGDRSHDINENKESTE